MNKTYTQQLISSLKSEIKSDKLRLIDTSILEFEGDSYPKVKRLIMDDGYEDPLVVDFSTQLPSLTFPIDSFGVGILPPPAAAKNMADFLDGILSGNYTLKGKSFWGLQVYTIYIGDVTYRSTHRSGLGKMIPDSMAKFFGKVIHTE